MKHKLKVINNAVRTDGSGILAIYEVPFKYCVATSFRHVVYIALHVTTDVRLTDAYRTKAETAIHRKHNSSKILIKTSKVYGHEKGNNTYIAHSINCSCSGAVQRCCCVTDTAGIQPIGRRLCRGHGTLTCYQTAIHSPGLPFNSLHTNNQCNYMD